jgi:hypothetical protein
VNQLLTIGGGTSPIRIADGDLNLGSRPGRLELTLQVGHGQLQTRFSGGPVSGAKLHFLDTLAALNKALSSLHYVPDPGYRGADTLHIQILDLGNPPSSADAVTVDADLSIAVVVNDVPVINVPPPQATTMNLPLPLFVSGSPEITVQDRDIGLGALQLTLSVGHGTLAAHVLGKQFSGATVQFTGTLNEIRVLLATLVYTPAGGYVGGDDLQIQLVDPGNPPRAADTVTATQDLPISVVANDVPAISAPGPVTVFTAKSSFVHTPISITDRDVGDGTLYVTLQVDHGQLGFHNGSSTTMPVGLGSQLMLHGTPQQIDDELSLLVYIPDSGYVGPDTLYVEVVDPGNPADPLTTVAAYLTLAITVF